MQALTHTQTSTVKQSSQHGASCMHACVYEVWHCVFWSIRRFVFAIIPCQQHLGRQTIAEKIGSQTPFTLSLAGQCASSRLHTHRQTHTHTHPYYTCTSMQPHTHGKHTCPTEMHVTHTISRLSSKSCGAVLKDTTV